MSSTSRSQDITIPKIATVLAVALIALHCGGEEQPDSHDEVPGLAQLTQEIFEPGCAHDACHAGDQGLSGLSFASTDLAHEGLVDTTPHNGPARNDGLKRVDPGNPENSLLWLKLSESPDNLSTLGYGAAMPLGTSTEPGPQSMEAIRNWIEAGAPMEGVSFEADFVDTENFEDYVFCDADHEEGLRNCFGAEPDPDEALRLYSPKLVIPPNSDTTLCSYLDFFAPEEIELVATRGLQMNGGHHTAIFVANSPRSDFEPSHCDEQDMMNYRYVAAGGGGGGLDTEMPDGVALRIQEGQQVVIQSHYINTSDEPMVVMDAIDIEYATTDDHIVADPFAMLDGGFEVPAGAEDHRRVSECTADEPMDIYMLLGHTHEYGTHFEFEWIPDGGTPETLYHAVDGRLLRNNPEIKLYDPPLQIEAGDTFRMTCGWDNPYEHALIWPEEMCVSLMYYGPGRGWLTCDEDQAYPTELGGGGDGEGCADPADEGNALGVGRFCTDGGDECNDNGDAEFCLAQFDGASNFCSFLGCSSDDECGDDATCIDEGVGSACVPDTCLD